MSEASNGPPNPREARYREMRVRWSGCPVTMLLIAVCCAVAVLSQLGSDAQRVSALFFAEPQRGESIAALANRLDEIGRAEGWGTRDFAETMEKLQKATEAERRPFAQILDGQLWRLVTPMFIHFGVMHLVFNMMWMWTLGGVLETRLRQIRFVLLVVGIAVISNTVQAVFCGPNFGGMSGVVYGLVGYVVAFGKLHPTSALQIDPRTLRFMLGWMVLCFTGMFGPVANHAHIAGLLGGAGIGAAAAMRAGGWRALKRRHEFRRAISSGPATLHQCAVCEKTERHDPNLEFRVGADGNEYCDKHLPDAQ